MECVAKILEETKVPELPADLATPSPVASKKSVKFSEQVAKEFSMTKFALVQPKSNMAGPMEVEDEFAEAEEDFAPKSSSAKTILKRAKSPPPPPVSAEPEVSSSTEEEMPSSTQNETVTSSTESEAAETMLELGTSGQKSDKDTYLLVVDESNQIEDLNSQTFYIDSNSLANGDLSNMVLTTEQPANNGQNGQNGEAVQS